LELNCSHGTGRAINILMTREEGRGKREEGRVPAKEGLMKEAQGKMHIYSSDLDMLIQGVPGTRLVESRVVHMVWGI